MRAESGVLYLEASADGQVEKIMGDASWLPVPVRAHESLVYELFPALVGAHLIDRMDLDFVELAPDIYADIQFQCQDGRQFIWLRNTSRHASHIRAVQQVANARALKEAVASRWIDDIRRERSHLRMILDVMPVPVAFWSPSGELLFANTKFLTAGGERLRREVEGGGRVLAADGSAGPMAVPAEVWERALTMSGLDEIGFFRVANGGVKACRLVCDVSPTGDQAGFIDVMDGAVSG